MRAWYSYFIFHGHPIRSIEMLSKATLVLIFELVLAEVDVAPLITLAIKRARGILALSMNFFSMYKTNSAIIH